MAMAYLAQHAASPGRHWRTSSTAQVVDGIEMKGRGGTRSVRSSERRRRTRSRLWRTACAHSCKAPMSSFSRGVGSRRAR